MARSRDSSRRWVRIASGSSKGDRLSTVRPDYCTHGILVQVTNVGLGASGGEPERGLSERDNRRLLTVSAQQRTPSDATVRNGAIASSGLCFELRYMCEQLILIGHAGEVIGIRKTGQRIIATDALPCLPILDLF